MAEIQQKDHGHGGCTPLSGPIGDLQCHETNHASQFENEVWIKNIKTKNIQKIPEIYPVKPEKREDFGRMKLTGEPDVVEWFWKMESLVRWTIFRVAIYFVIEILTVPAVIDYNR